MCTRSYVCNSDIRFMVHVHVLEAIFVALMSGLLRKLEAMYVTVMSVS